MQIGNLISAEVKGRLYRAAPPPPKTPKVKRGKGRVTATQIAAARAKAQYLRLKALGEGE